MPTTTRLAMRSAIVHLLVVRLGLRRLRPHDCQPRPAPRDGRSSADTDMPPSQFPGPQGDLVRVQRRGLAHAPRLKVKQMELVHGSSLPVVDWVRERGTRNACGWRSGEVFQSRVLSG
jgi:hypothetical protein